MITLKILSENRDNCEFKGEGGLSILVDAFGQSFLMDTGYSNLFLKNSKLMGIELDCVEKVILTHGHSDHTSGVAFLQNGKTIICHPFAFKDRWSIRKQEYVGFPAKKEDLQQKHNLMLSKDAVEFCENCFFLGEIPMEIDFEKSGNFSTMLDENLSQKDLTEDDSGVAIVTEKGLFVMTGCGHRGICNTIEQAKKVTGQDKVYGVLGGFHLRNLEKQKNMIDKTIEYFQKNEIKELFLGHCVTDDVIDYFENALPKIKISRLASGKIFEVEI